MGQRGGDSDFGGMDPRQRALALIEAQHAFPGPFDFRVVLRPEGRAAVLGALMSAAGPSAVLLDVRERTSNAGRYVSLRIRVELERSELVLDVYEVLRNVDMVITAF